MEVLKSTLMALIGIFIGLAAGLLLPVGIPVAGWLYAVVALLALLSSLVHVVVQSESEPFSLGLFLAEGLGGGVLAIALCWLGERLAIPFWLAAVVFFGVSILMPFANFGGTFPTKYRQNRHIGHDFDN